MKFSRSKKIAKIDYSKIVKDAPEMSLGFFLTVMIINICFLFDEDQEADLSEKLSGLLEEIKSVMESRKTRIDELRGEIEQIEQQNSDLETTIADILSSFDDK